MSNHAKNKFDIICNTVDNGIIVLNKDLKVFFWNRWLETRTGIEANSIIDKNILDFYSNIDEKKLIIINELYYLDKNANLNINKHFLTFYLNFIP